MENGNWFWVLSLDQQSFNAVLKALDLWFQLRAFINSYRASDYWARYTTCTAKSWKEREKERHTDVKFNKLQLSEILKCIMTCNTNTWATFNQCGPKKSYDICRGKGTKIFIHVNVTLWVPCGLHNCSRAACSLPVGRWLPTTVIVIHICLLIYFCFCYMWIKLSVLTTVRQQL